MRRVLKAFVLVRKITYRPLIKPIYPYAIGPPTKQIRGLQFMLNAAQTFRFEVAFSFAAAHRGKVREIAEIVAERLGKDQLLFDEWYEHEIFGDDMDVLLQRFYHEQSLLVLAELSDDYTDRPWWQAEARAIRALPFEIDLARDETQRLRLLNDHFGPGEVPGIFKTMACLDSIKKTAQQCADLILKRLDRLRRQLAAGASAESQRIPTHATKRRYYTIFHLRVTPYALTGPSNCGRYAKGCSRVVWARYSNRSGARVGRDGCLNMQPTQRPTE